MTSQLQFSCEEKVAAASCTLKPLKQEVRQEASELRGLAAAAAAGRGAKH